MSSKIRIRQFALRAKLIKTCRKDGDLIEPMEPTGRIGRIDLFVLDPIRLIDPIHFLAPIQPSGLVDPIDPIDLTTYTDPFVPMLPADPISPAVP